MSYPAFAAMGRCGTGGYSPPSIRPGLRTELAEDLGGGGREFGEVEVEFTLVLAEALGCRIRHLDLSFSLEVELTLVLAEALSGRV